MSKIILLMFSSKIFKISSLTFKSLIHFKFILVYGVKRQSSFFFCMYLFNFPNTICWIDYPTDCFCLFCQILIDYKSVGLLLSSILFHWSICLYICFYAITMLFWLLRTYSLVWYWVCDSSSLFFSRLLLLLGAFHGPI